ncbi:MAG: LicD family protein [Oscillospiraceae bacterium]|nr:LicD family protein [Oscillospiraceae bacterium]
MSEKSWKATYNQTDNSELRKLQLALLENIKVFVAICEKYGLRYFMIGGTMLGAIRHKGFIPWDDDVDMGMPREDYEIFLKIAPAEMPKGYAFLNYKSNANYHRYFSRVVDTRVEIYNNSNSVEIVENAWVDIFPFDGLPKGKFRSRFHFWHMTFWRFLYHASCFDELVNLNRPGRPWYQQKVIRFLQVTRFGKKLNTKKILERIERGLTKYSYDSSDTVVNFFGAYMSKEIIEKSLLGNLKKYGFEDSEFYGAEKYDEYLRSFYGDYMILPNDVDRDKHDIRRIEYSE